MDRTTRSLSFLHFTTFRVHGFRVIIFSSSMCYFYRVCQTTLSSVVTSVDLPDVQFARSSVEDLADYTSHTNKTQQAFRSTESSSLGSLFSSLMCEQLFLKILNSHIEYEGYFLMRRRWCAHFPTAVFC